MKATGLQERMMIVEMAQAGHTDAEIAACSGWSISTVRKWRRRWQRQGWPGLASAMGRPATGPLSSFAPTVQAQVAAWATAHPAWGPDTLHAELVRDKALADTRLPSRSTLARWRHHAGKARAYERHTTLPQTVTSTAVAPHEEWELDARGYAQVPDIGIIALINLNDRVSRMKLLSYPCELGAQRAQRHATTADYQMTIRLAASEWGLPDRLCVDRDSVFYDNTSKSPFPTRFHLWLLALGVTLCIGPPHMPQKRGMTERSHQLWAQQVLDGQTFTTWDQLYRALRERRDFMNRRLPCASLGDQAPLAAYPDAAHPRRAYRPEWELELLHLEPVQRYLAQGHWFRKGSNVGTVSLGGHRYPLGHAWARANVEITYDANDGYLTFRSPDVVFSQQRPIQGLTALDLAGELGPLLLLPHFQLELPFTWKERRLSRLCETLGIMT